MPISTESKVYIRSAVKSYIQRQKLQVTNVLIWSWTQRQWEVWNERALRKTLTLVRRTDTAWGDIE